MKRVICTMQAVIDRHNLSVSTSGKGERLSQAAVAEGAGIARSTVNRLYTNTANRVDFSTVAALCEFFDCEVSDLFTIKEDR